MADPDQVKDPALAQALISALDAYTAGSLEDRFASARAQEQIIRALGKTGDPKACPCLLARFSNGLHYIRVEVARALGDLKDTRAVSPLIEALRLRDYTRREEDLKKELRDAIQGALVAITGAGKDFQGDPKRWSRWYSQNLPAPDRSLP
jgi:HEAT repeat protein